LCEVSLKCLHQAVRAWHLENGFVAVCEFDCLPGSAEPGDVNVAEVESHRELNCVNNWVDFDDLGNCVDGASDYEFHVIL